MKSASFSRLALPALVVAVSMILATGVASAQTQPVKCSSQITACGCTITTPGGYTIENNLDYSQGLTLKSGCIDISASNVDLYAYALITGPGTNPACDIGNPKKSADTGIHVLPGAKNVSIFFYEYGPCGWNYGLESEGSGVNSYYPYAYYNNVGILLNNATGNDVLYYYGEYNTTGLEIAGGSGNSINGSEVEESTQYGFWLNGTKDNTLVDNGAYYNTIAGFYLGCNATGNVKPSIPCTIATTTGNSLQDNSAYGEAATSYTQKYGIAVERGSINNTFLEDYTYDPYNTPYRNKTDIIDGNGNCVYNTYLDDVYLTKSPSCIQ